MPNTAEPSLSPEHAELLRHHAVDLGVAAAAGVRSVLTREDLPEPLREIGWIADLVPGIVYVWRHQGITEYQFATDDRSDDRPKYAFRPGATPVPNQVRETGDGGPVLLVEGTKQQLAAASWVDQSWSVYGIAGCWSWTTADLSFVSDRKVVVIYDGDVTINRHVWDAGERLAETLHLYGADMVTFVRVPTTGSDGLDDLLGRIPPTQRGSALKRLLDKAGKLPKRPPRRPAESGNAYIDPANGGFQVRRLAAAVYERWPMALTRERRPAVYQRGTYRMDGTALVSAVTQLMGEQYRPAQLSAVTDVLVGTLYDEGIFLPDHLDKPLLNCRNGMLDLETGTLYPHAPSYLSSLQIPLCWTPDAEAPVYNEWLDQVLGDQAEDLEEVTASMLDPSRTPSKAVFLFGPSKSGKSTYLRLMRAVAGSANVSAVGLHQLVVNRFMAAMVYGMMLNAHADLSAAHVEDVSLFKMMIGDDLIPADRKYGGTFNFVNQALFAFSANDPPTVGESSRAYAERIKPFKFPFSFAGREDPTIEDHIMAHELEGVLVRWVAAWQRRQQRGSWHPTAPEVQHEFEVRSDRVRQWVDEEMIVWPVNGTYQNRDECTVPRDLARAFNRWAEDNAGSKMGERKIIDRLRTMPDVAEVRQRETRARALNLTKRPPGESGGSLLGQTAPRSEQTAHESGQVTPDGAEGAVSAHPTYTLCKKHGPEGQVLEQVENTETIGRGGPKLPLLPTPDPGEPVNDVETAPGQRVDDVEPAASADQHDDLGPALIGPEFTAPVGSVLDFDLETYDAGDIWHRGPDFVFAAGYRGSQDPEALLTTDIDALTHQLAAPGTTVRGHNVLNFDLVALARYHGLDQLSLTWRGGVVDTKLLAFLADPPPARMGSGECEKHYKLDAVGQRLFGVGKQGTFADLLAKHNGDRLSLRHDPEFVEYLRQDVALTGRLARHFGTWPYAEREHRVLAVLSQMSLNGFRVDTGLLNQRYAEGEATKARLQERLVTEYGMPTDTAAGKPAKSPWTTAKGKAAISAAFQAAGGPPLPISPKGNTLTSKTVMEALVVRYEDEVPEVAQLARVVMELQGVRSIYGTVLDHLVGDRVHPKFDARQASGRISTINPGLTVIGKRDGRVREREIFLPEEGHVIITADLAQCDARVVAALSQDHAYMDLFEPDGSGLDLWSRFALRLFGTVDKREWAKWIGHGSNYGQGAAAISTTYGVPRDEVDRYLAERAEQFPRLARWTNEVRERARAGDLLDNGWGRLMRPDPHRYYTQGPALMGQGGTRDVMAEGMLRLVTAVPEVAPLLRATVHDELVLSVPVDWADDVERVLVECMSFEWCPPGGSRPIKIMADVGQRGQTWAGAYAK